jgi:hypothetical protein
MIGYAAASQSATQVAAMLGGPPASDRRVQDQLNELLASKSRPELWEVLRLLKEFLGGDRQAASQYFAERPGLTKAVFQAQVLLGESGGARQCSMRVKQLKTFDTYVCEALVLKLCWYIASRVCSSGRLCKRWLQDCGFDKLATAALTFIRFPRVHGAEHSPRKLAAPNKLIPASPHRLSSAARRQRCSAART